MGSSVIMDLVANLPADRPPTRLSDKGCSDSMKLLQQAEARECAAVQAVVDGEIARDDANRITQMQQKFTNGELEQKMLATEELKQFLEDSLALVETEERLLAAEIIELDRMERSH